MARLTVAQTQINNLADRLLNELAQREVGDIPTKDLINYFIQVHKLNQKLNHEDDIPESEMSYAQLAAKRAKTNK
jgi:hypothetical protein